MTGELTLTEAQGTQIIALLADMVQILRAIGEILATTMQYSIASALLLLVVIFFAAVGRRAV